MSEEITEKAYSSAADRVGAEHEEAVEKAKAAVAKAKSDALKKLRS